MFYDKSVPIHKNKLSKFEMSNRLFWHWEDEHMHKNVVFFDFDTPPSSSCSGGVVTFFKTGFCKEI